MRRSVSAPACLLVLSWVGPVNGQAPPAGDTRFAAFDVAIGAVAVDDAEPGLSYGAGLEVANLLVGGTTVRFGFRFWSTEDASTGVDIDDAVLEAVVKLHARLGRLTPYVGAGIGAHFVSARFASDPVLQDERDGFAPGLQLLAGSEVTVGGEAFLAPYVEAEGAFVAGVSHALLHAGVRVRFDRLSGP